MLPASGLRVASLLLVLAALACGGSPSESSDPQPSGSIDTIDPPDVIGWPGTGGSTGAGGGLDFSSGSSVSGSGLTVTTLRESTLLLVPIVLPTPPSAVNGAAPWALLGELTGSYSAQVTALASDCVAGPEVPFSPRFPGEPFEPFSSLYGGTLEQRGDDVVFQIGEGLVFARRQANRLVDVVRVGAEGVTRYDDGLWIEPSASGFVISGESAWSFEGTVSAESCRGRTAWSIRVQSDKPIPGARDLQFVLRWPATSHADLDLMVGSAFLGQVQSRCHVLHSAGTAGAADDSQPVAWIHPLSDTRLAYHEEIIRCASAAYGSWDVDVVNWSGDEPVDFEVEVFEGPTVGTSLRDERRFGLLEGTAAPHTRAQRAFNYQPPPTSYGASISATFVILRQPLRRPNDPVSGSVLGFNKAAALDVSYAEFLANSGL